jgi:hypothetical protein
VHNVEQAVAQDLPEILQKFMRETCGLRVDAFRPREGVELPQPDQRLLVHANDMTSTLAGFHGSSLRVEVLQRVQRDTLYLREVFLRTRDRDRIVEYGVIAIALEQFAPAQQDLILAGQIPLGALLHRFHLQFVSAPIGFFAVSASDLAETPLHIPEGSTCYGRFNRLAKTTGDPLAWILEILPPAAT